MLVKSLREQRNTISFTEPMLLLVAIFWGTSYGLTKEALAYSSVLVFIILRFLLTFLVMLPVVIRDFKQDLNRDWKVAIPTGLVLSAIFFCEVFGVSQTSASNAAFLISLSVIFTTFAELLINKKKVSLLLWGMSFASVLGVFLLTYQPRNTYNLNVGDYFILGAAVLRAIMVTTTKCLIEGKSITTSTLTSLQSLTVALVTLLVASIYLPVNQLILPEQPKFWLILLYLVLCCTLFAFFVQNYAVRRTSPTRVSLLMGSEPLFGAAFAMLWLDESLSVIQLFGGLIILICVLMTSIKIKS
ncbi:DMT family transporter [Vibrio neonatus]|uniref:DMT family transporter n=1 Tax=Vibrio neonatus TaxID=278860 RepID=UPI0021C3B528|nr:DMT family transporter [Vibrio neonatus]